MFSAVAEVVPAFGGAFVDHAAGSLLIWMTDSPDQASSARDILVGLLQDPTLTDLTVVAVTADFAFSELKRWYDRIALVALAMPGIVSTDIDELANRLHIGIDGQTASTTRLKDMLRALDVPLEAVIIEPVAPVQLQLQGYIRPLVGGIQIGTERFICSLGFVALRSGVSGIVTASHCTDRMGGVEGTIFGQPTVSSPVARESVDPALFSGNGCPLGRRCRYSDAAFARLFPSVPFSQGHIANPQEDSFLWNVISTYRVRSEGIPLVGQAVSKIGRTTGQTQGTVTRTCVDLSVSNTDIVMLCQAQAGYASASGDSGGPIIRADYGPASRDITLLGIHWGSGGSFSPMQNIQTFTELGDLQTCALPFPC